MSPSGGRLHPGARAPGFRIAIFPPFASLPDPGFDS